MQLKIEKAKFANFQLKEISLALQKGLKKL